MASKDFRQTLQTVSQNFQKYTDAMEADLQLLISSILEGIESKIVSLRKLLKLKLCIKKVKSVADLQCLATLDGQSLRTILSLDEKEDKKLNDSLDDLSSIVYEVDRDSLPQVADDKTQTRLMCLEDIVDIESLCSALNCKMTESQKDVNKKTDIRKSSLEKYIYLLLDAEKQKEKLKDVLQVNKNQGLSEKIGDGAKVQPGDSKCPSEESMVCLGKREYKSILDILNMVLRSYKLQDEIVARRKAIEKARTEPSIATTVKQHDERKIVSDSLCQQKDKQQTMDAKSPKNRKNCCV